MYWTTHQVNVLLGFAGTLAFFLRNFQSWFDITVAGFQRYIFFNILLQGLDGHGFVGINFCTPVLTSTCAGITATPMCGATGFFTYFSDHVTSGKFEFVAIFAVVLRHSNMITQAF